jgi:hypothetical protein
MFKKVFRHIEVAHVGVFFGFITLGIALHKDYGIGIPLAVVVVGGLLAWSAARNTYQKNSTVLVDKYDERFSEGLKRQRRSAALFLLGENPSGDELEDVLDFFESPIAEKVSDGSIDTEQIYSVFYHWIRLYYQASQKFREEYRKGEPAAYTNLAELYDQTSKFERLEIEKELERKCKLEDLLLSQEELTKYLQQEANLKTESSDWGKLFHQKKS